MLARLWFCDIFFVKFVEIMFKFEFPVWYRLWIFFNCFAEFWNGLVTLFSCSTTSGTRRSFDCNFWVILFLFLPSVDVLQNTKELVQPPVFGFRLTVGELIVKQSYLRLLLLIILIFCFFKLFLRGVVYILASLFICFYRVTLGYWLLILHYYCLIHFQLHIDIELCLLLDYYFLLNFFEMVKNNGICHHDSDLSLEDVHCFHYLIHYCKD